MRTWNFATGLNTNIEAHKVLHLLTTKSKNFSVTELLDMKFSYEIVAANFGKFA
jgi:hypothetical protein